MSSVCPGLAADAATLLCALQLGDSSFPTGGYTLSHGLETAIEIGRVRDATDAEVYLRVLLEDIVGPTDLVALVSAARAATDLAEVVAIDCALDARKLAREPREASRRAGRAMLAIAAVLIPDPHPLPLSYEGRGERDFPPPLGEGWSEGVPGQPLATYAEAVQMSNAPGTHAVVFGLVTRLLGLTPETAACVYVHGFAASFASALGRLLPVDHLTIQALIRRGHAVAVPTIERALATPWSAMASAAPEAEVFSLIHERSLMRAFAT